MLQSKVTITNEIGMHARPASQFIKLLSDIKSDVKINNGKKTGNARSIIVLLSMAVKKNDEITVIVEGEDEEAAMPRIIEFLENMED